MRIYHSSITVEQDVGTGGDGEATTRPAGPYSSPAMRGVGSMSYSNACFGLIYMPFEGPLPIGPPRPVTVFS